MDSYFGNKFLYQVSDFEYYSCRFSPFDKNLIACSQSQYYGIVGNGRLCVYAFDFLTKSIKEIKRFNTNDGCFDVAWSEANENILASCQGDGTIKIWDLNNQFPVGNIQAHAQDAYSVNCNQTQPQLMISGGKDMTVKTHDMIKMQTINNFTDHKGVVYNTIWHPTFSGVFASCSEDGSFKVWDLKSPSPVQSIKAHNCHCMSIDFDKYENMLVSAGSDGSLALWDLRGNRNTPLFCLKAHSLTIKKVCLSPFASQVVASVGYDMNVRVWDLKTSQSLEIFKHHKEFVFGLDFSMLEENVVATCGWDRALSIYKWDELKNKVPMK